MYLCLNWEGSNQSVHSSNQVRTVDVRLKNQRILKTVTLYYRANPGLSFFLSYYLGCTVLLTVSRRFLYCSSSLFVRQWFHMWSLFSHVCSSPLLLLVSHASWLWHFQGILSFIFYHFVNLYRQFRSLHRLQLTPVCCVKSITANSANGACLDPEIFNRVVNEPVWPLTPVVSVLATALPWS